MFDYSKQKPLREYTAYYEPGSKRGSIVIYDDGIVLKEGRKETPVRSSYIQSVEREDETPILGKIGIEIGYYNMFGNKESAQLKMRENDFYALKKDVGK